MCNCDDDSHPGKTLKERRLNVKRKPLSQATDLIATFPELVECHRVTGTDSYILKVIVSSIPHLEQVINRLAPYGEPATSIVLSSIVSGEIVKREAWWNGKELTTQG